MWGASREQLTAAPARTQAAAAVAGRAVPTCAHLHRSRSAQCPHVTPEHPINEATGERALAGATESEGCGFNYGRGGC